MKNLFLVICLSVLFGGSSYGQSAKRDVDESVRLQFRGAVSVVLSSKLLSAKEEGLKDRVAFGAVREDVMAQLKDISFVEKKRCPGCFVFSLSYQLNVGGITFEKTLIAQTRGSVPVDEDGSPLGSKMLIKVVDIYEVED